MWNFLYKLASPKSFYRFSSVFIVIFSVLSALLFIYGVIGGLILAPADYQQGDAFRIIYIHVPAAFLSMFVYGVMAFCALLSIVWRIKMASIVIEASSSLGALFTAIALVTGSFWGKPMWGTWWIWDARLTSELILLFWYVAVIALQHALKTKTRGQEAVAWLVLVGVINLPIIHYSVYWWNTLHQGATLSRFAKPLIAGSMLYPLLAMIAAFLCYFFAMLFFRSRTVLLKHEANSAWVKTI